MSVQKAQEILRQGITGTSRQPVRVSTPTVETQQSTPSRSVGGIPVIDRGFGDTNLMSPIPTSVVREQGFNVITLPDGTQFQMDDRGNPVQIERGLTTAQKNDLRGGSFAETGDEIDHIIPVALGGTDAEGNLRARHSRKTVSQAVWDFVTGKNRLPGEYRPQNRQEGKMIVEWRAIERYEAGDITLFEAMAAVRNYDNKELVNDFLGEDFYDIPTEKEEARRQTVKEIFTNPLGPIQGAASVVGQQAGEAAANWLSDKVKQSRRNGIINDMVGFLGGKRFVDTEDGKSMIFEVGAGLDAHQALIARETVQQNIEQGAQQPETPFIYDTPRRQALLTATAPIRWTAGSLSRFLIGLDFEINGVDAKFTPETELQEFIMGKGDFQRLSTSDDLYGMAQQIVTEKLEERGIAHDSAHTAGMSTAILLGAALENPFFSFGKKPAKEAIEAALVNGLERELGGELSEVAVERIAKEADRIVAMESAEIQQQALQEFVETAKTQRDTFIRTSGIPERQIKTVEDVSRVPNVTTRVSEAKETPISRTALEAVEKTEDGAVRINPKDRAIAMRADFDNVPTATLLDPDTSKAIKREMLSARRDILETTMKENERFLDDVIAREVRREAAETARNNIEGYELAIDAIKNSGIYRKEGTIGDVLNEAAIMRNQKGRVVAVPPEKMEDFFRRGYRTVHTVDSMATNNGFDSVDDFLEYIQELDDTLKTVRPLKEETLAHKYLMENDPNYVSLNQQIERFREELKLAEEGISPFGPNAETIDLNARAIAEEEQLIMKYRGPRVEGDPDVPAGSAAAGQVRANLNKIPANIYDEDAIKAGLQNRNYFKGTFQDLKQSAGDLAEELFAPISTRLQNIDQSLKNTLREFEFNTAKRISEDSQAITPFLEKAQGMSAVDMARFDLAAKNGDQAMINVLAKQYGFQEELKSVRKVLDGLYADARRVGFDIDYLPGYFPRRVRNAKKFVEHFEKTEGWSIMRQAIQEKETQLQRVLTIEEKAELLNSLIRGYGDGKITLSATGSMKGRVIDIVDPKINNYYTSTFDALVNYVRSVTEAIEARRFFGKGVRKQALEESALIKQVAPEQRELVERALNYPSLSEFKKAVDPGDDAELIKQIDDVWKTATNIRNQIPVVKEGDKLFTEAPNIQDSIGAYTTNLLAEGKITANEEETLRNILQARFNQKSMHPALGLYRNLSYIDTMGSPISAITQIGDLGLSVYRTGPFRTTSEFLKSLFGKSDISIRDIGIDKIAQEFTDGSKSGRLVDKVFRAVGLDKIDRLGKETFVNSVMSKYRRQARMTTPPKELLERITPVFGDETPKVLSELKAGLTTENTKLLAFNELLDVQPVALSEMPEKYLSSPNGRIFYMLKTFQLKQFDIYRREVFQQLAKPGLENKIKGLKNLTLLAGSLMAMNATADEVKDLILNRETSWEDRLVDNVLRQVGFSKFAIYKARQEGIASATVRQILPPFKFIDALYKDVTQSREISELETINSIPVGGKLYYWWFGRGDSKSDDERERILIDETADWLTTLPADRAAEEYDTFVEANPGLENRLRTTVRDLQTGITDQEKKIRSLGVSDGERAQRVFQELQKLDSDAERAELWDDWVEKRILTDSVQDQVLELLNQ